MKALIFVLTMLISISAFSQEKQFFKTCKKNTVESYEKFISKFPDSEYTELAEFKKAELVNSSLSFEYFLKKYPDGEFSKEAMSKLCTIEYLKIENSESIESFKDYLKQFSDCQDNNKKAETKLIALEYKKALSENTIDALESFLITYPKNDYSIQTKKRIEELEFEIAKKENSIIALNSFIEKYPEGNYCNEAKKLIEKIDFNEAIVTNTIIAYNKYLQKYPNGIYKIKAERAIEEIDFNKTKDSLSIEAFQNYILKYPQGIYKNDAENGINEIIKKFNKTNITKIKKGIAEIKKIDPTYNSYKIGAMKQIPANINIITKSNLRYFTKVINGYMGDVELTDKEITEITNLLSTTLKSRINISLNTPSDYQLFVIINCSAPYTYMDNRGYPWSGITGSIFLINSKEKLLFNYDEIDIRGNELNATIIKYANEASTKFTNWTKQ
jgi:outer membrane protein assembly factor BamD (BamD/ComL family)